MFEDLIGRVLDERYEIQALLNSSDIALVFAAYDRSLDCQAIVKIFKPEYAQSAEAIARLTQLKHRYILSIRYQGTCAIGNQELRFLVTRQPKGDTLADLLTKRTLYLEDIERILRQVCEALDCAYDYGLVHPDLNPDNVMLDEGGNVLLTDFRPIQLPTQTSKTGVQVDEPREQQSQNPTGLFSEVCNLGTTLYKNVLIRPGHATPTHSWRRQTLWASVGAALALAAVGLMLLRGSQPSPYPSPETPPAGTPPATPAPPTVTSTPLSPSPVATATPAPSPTPFLVVSVERLRIYAGPGETYAVLGEVRRGDQLPLLGCSADWVWWQVDYFGRKGWIPTQSGNSSVECSTLPMVETPLLPTISPTPTATPSPLPTNLSLPLQNPDLADATEGSITGWHISSEDNYDSPSEYDPDNSFDTPRFGQTNDPTRMLNNGPTLQIEATAFVKFRVYISQTVSALPAVTVRFEAWAQAYSDADSGGIRLAAGIDPDGGTDCSQAQWGNRLPVGQADGPVRLVAPDVAAGPAGQVTVCLYAEPIAPARSNAAFFADAQLIANPE